ncbi:hypothetical protein WN51_11030 [Melipona quadrifasciata]|uniref:Uncharacterized protein n=1 Tax=Melipona quadrifasciata TaxID=166423 RepID=A0A0M9A3V2_9HYME|nr:hypothetical protein WN51_11030 [Melipona quadrifasciata]
MRRMRTNHAARRYDDSLDNEIVDIRVLIGEKTAVCPGASRAASAFAVAIRTSQHLGVSRVHCRLLGFSPELGQRVHFAEGTNLRCCEDKKSPTDDDDSEERSEVVRLIRDRSSAVMRKFRVGQGKDFKLQMLHRIEDAVSTWRRMCVPDRNVILANRSSVERWNRTKDLATRVHIFETVVRS